MRISMLFMAFVSVLVLGWFLINNDKNSIFFDNSQVFSYDTQEKSVVIVKVPNGHGSGFYIGDDLIVTAKHVIDKIKDYSFTAITHDNKTMDLEVVYKSETIDLAVLRIKDKKHNLVPVKFAKRNAKIGENIYMISSPFSMKWSFSYSRGYVMNDKFIDLDVDFAVYDGEYFLYNLARYRGSSGASIFNAKGEVVGMMNALLIDSSIGFGLTLETMKKELKENNFLKEEKKYLYF